jgi:hypothetical protein
VTRALACAAAALWLLACEGEPPALGIGARVTLDRSETHVGEPIGVTVEVDTPAGYSVQAPPAPSGGPFASDSVELIAPIPVPGGVRHHLLWTVRARDVGEQALPWLEIPLIRPDGNVQPLRVGGVPLPVLSVKAELPERAAVFDIRMAPPQKPLPWWAWLAGAAGLALLALAARVLRRRARAAEAHAGRIATAGRTALAALEDVEGEADPRSFAQRVRVALLGFVATIWAVDTASVTPRELPAEVDGDIARLLGGLDAVRFARRPERAELAAFAERARERVRHVANLRA